MSYDKIQVPEGGTIAMLEYGHLDVPDNPIIPFIEGDGVGPEVAAAAVKSKLQSLQTVWSQSTAFRKQ